MRQQQADIPRSQQPCLYNSLPPQQVSLQTGRKWPLLEADNRSIRLDGGSIIRTVHPVSDRWLRCCWIGVVISTCLGRKIEITEDRKSPESWDCLSLAPSVYEGRNMERSVFALRFCRACSYCCWWMGRSVSVYKLLYKPPVASFASGNLPWQERFLVSRCFLPLLQHGLAGFRLRLRLPARDQRQAPGGDRSAVREPALLLQRLGFRRRAPGGIHPRQRLKLPSIRQRCIRCGLKIELFVGADLSC